MFCKQCHQHSSLDSLFENDLCALCSGKEMEFDLRYPRHKIYLPPDMTTIPCNFCCRYIIQEPYDGTKSTFESFAITAENQWYCYDCFLGHVFYFLQMRMMNDLSLFLNKHWIIDIFRVYAELSPKGTVLFGDLADQVLKDKDVRVEDF